MCVRQTSEKVIVLKIYMSHTNGKFYIMGNEEMDFIRQTINQIQYGKYQLKGLFQIKIKKQDFKYR